jgi:hypothetical protein
VDARPSDSIAIALRMAAPIYTTDDLLEHTSIEIADPSEDIGANEAQGSSGEPGRGKGTGPVTAEELREYLRRMHPKTSADSTHDAFVNPTFRLRSLPPSSRKRVRHFIRTLLACGAVLASPGASHGQDVSVAGRVIDANGDVVASRTVVLHRVTPDGGALLAQDTTNSEGGFLLEAPAALRQDGVFFVAARHEGELYIGPLLRPPLPAPGDYVLEVGVPGRAPGGRRRDHPTRSAGAGKRHRLLATMAARARAAARAPRPRRMGHRTSQWPSRAPPPAHPPGRARQRVGGGRGPGSTMRVISRSGAAFWSASAPPAELHVGDLRRRHHPAGVPLRRDEPDPAPHHCTPRGAVRHRPGRTSTAQPLWWCTRALRRGCRHAASEGLARLADAHGFDLTVARGDSVPACFGLQARPSSPRS